MAGSIMHVKKENGEWVTDSREFCDMIENLGDAFEMYEEMRDLIQSLQAENKKLREGLSFTLLAAEHLYKPDEPLPEGLPAIYYHTLSYKGDLELIEKTKQARKLLDLYKGE